MEKKERLFWRVLDGTLTVLSVALLAAVLLLMTLQIVMRYAFGTPLTWSEELARYAMVWMTFIGAALAVKKKAHICVDLIVGAFPERMRRIVGYATKVLTLVFLGVATWQGILYVQMNLRNYSLISGICKGHVYAIIPVCLGLMFLNTLRVFKEE